MTLKWRNELPHLAVIASMFAAAVLVWPLAPEQLPVHWDLFGTPDRFGGREEALLVVPFLALALYVLLAVLPQVDPLRANYARFADAYTVIRYAAIVPLGVIHLSHVLAVTGPEVSVRVVAYGLVAVLMIIFGVISPRLQQNWLVGVRTPWTLSSRRSWERTHRVARWVFFATAVGFVIPTVSSHPLSLGVAFAGLLIGAGFLVVYSYVAWREDARPG